MFSPFFLWSRIKEEKMKKKDKNHEAMVEMTAKIQEFIQEDMSLN